MSKKIHTIQSSDKVEFDKEVNFFLELGCELLEGSYEVVKEDDGNVYSQVVTIDTDKYDVEFYKDGQRQYCGSLNKDGNKDGLWTNWYMNGQKSSEVTYKDNELDGKYIEWYENGQKSSEVTYKDGEPHGDWTEWYDNGRREREGIYKDGELVQKFTYFHRSGEPYPDGTEK